MLVKSEVERLVLQAKRLPPVGTAFVDIQLIPCLLTTVIDFQMQTTVVQKALGYFQDHESDQIRALQDLEAVFSHFPDDDREANTRIATLLCGYKFVDSDGIASCTCRVDATQRVRRPC